MDVAIPQGASKSQVEAIQKAIEYGKNNGVQVNIHVIQPTGMIKKLFPNRRAAYEWEYKQNTIQRGPLNKNMH